MRCRRPLIPATAVAAAAMFVAGCGGGGGSSPGIASVSSSSSSSTSSSSSGPPSQALLLQEQREAARFAQCMRSHGVPIPNPTVAPRAFKDAFNTHSAAFRSGYTACGHLLPAGHAPNQNPPNSQAQTVALLAFARCLRSHGFPSFPDPTSAGQITHEMLANLGINLHGPGLLAAADACTTVTHGVITRTVVANFVAGH